jgi:glycosyltransferase involved in cell wall biosynthesis
MKVCMVAYSFYERDNRIMRYADALVRAGHEVDVVALRMLNQDYFENVRGANVFRIQTRTFPEKTGKLAYFARLCRFLIKSAFWLTRKYITKRYDLIHVHSVPDFEVFAAIIPLILGCKIILDIHDIVPEFYCSKFETSRRSFVFRVLIIVERISIAFSHHVIIANHLWYSRLIERSVASSKCSVILNYPDPDIFKAIANKKINKDFLMIYPGTINYHQGLDLLVQAFSLVKDQMPNAKLLIYGEGPDREQLGALVETLGMSDKVEIFKPLKLTEIARVMANADLGVVPKRGDTFGDEAFSTKSLEFMAVGVPLIMSGTTIDKYYFTDKQVRFFESGNIEDLARNILYLYHRPEKRKALTDNGYRYVSELTWDKKKHEYLTLLNSLIDKKRTPSPTGPFRWRFYALYYPIKTLLPRAAQVAIRKLWVKSRYSASRDQWPIDPSASLVPRNFSGWPEGKQFALVLRHDVETAIGRDLCKRILKIEANFGLNSAFYLVPEGYSVSADLRESILSAGGEVGVHGLNHDGKLYNSRKHFARRAVKINQYISAWGAAGFASPSAHHELNWLETLGAEYDSSTFDTDPFEPQPDAAKTIFPFTVIGENRDFVELPYTLPQDFTIMILMGHQDISVWKKKLDWVASQGGMALLITHPDYMQFDGEEKRPFTYPARLYKDFLEYVTETYSGRYWNGLPRDVASFWKDIVK